MRTREKNFTYGDLWEQAPLPAPKGRGRRTVHPETLTSNQAFISYLQRSGYRVVLDHDYQAYAHTAPGEKEIVLNGNYPPHILEAFLKHELGHLMLFDVNSFTTVKEDTLRSMIAKVLYTPEHLRRCGAEQLFYVENIIQDIVIETVSNGNCVCSGLLTHSGTNAGVKHLTELESVGLIAEETCRSLLQDKPQWHRPRPFDQQALEQLLDSLLKDVQADRSEIEAKHQKTLQEEVYKQEAKSRSFKEVQKLQRQLEGLDKKLAKAKTPSPRTHELRDSVAEKLAQAKSKERAEELEAEAKGRWEKELKRLEKHAEQRKELEAAFQEALEQLQAEAEALAQEGGGQPGQAQDQGACQGQAASEGEGQAGEVSGKGSGAPGEGQGVPSQQANGALQEASPELQRNYTDHLTTEAQAGGRGHSCDCGLPLPLTVTREESVKNERNLARLHGQAPSRRRIVQVDEEAQDEVGGRNKSQEKELTYFKNSKKEFDATDMLKGRRRLRMTGVNVLVGLDVSGSMAHEWTVMFKAIGEQLEKLQESLDIERVVFFTYHTKITGMSEDLEDLRLVAGGGNAFGYVYQELMATAPLMQRNEIILITDCGDNLGFRLEDSCLAMRKNEPVKNHISVVDTENAGFYALEAFEGKDWSLYRLDDPKLFAHLRTNISQLIEA